MLFDSWILLSFFSALFLGFYDAVKKNAVSKNAALATLFGATTSGGLICLLILLWRELHPTSFVPYGGNWPDLTLRNHLYIAIKAVIVSGSWTFSYLALKHLPLSIVAPLRASGPVWTLGLAVFFFAERPVLMQILGFALTLLSYLWFSILGRRDGLKLWGNPWVLCILMGTWIGAISGVYDKWLIQVQNLPPVAVQLYFSVDMVFFQALLFGVMSIFKKEKTRFQWRWSIPLVAILLLIADAFYFRALDNEQALVGVVSALRRGSLLVAFALSCWWFKEKNAKDKTWPVVGVAVGLGILACSSH
jgi:drug/metabolite transporter (DMT)-like permease